MLLTKNTEHHCSGASESCEFNATASLRVSPTGETVDAGGDGTLVGQVSGDAPFVLGSSAPNESRVEDESVLGGVTACFQGSEKETPLSVTAVVILAKQRPLTAERRYFFSGKSERSHTQSRPIVSTSVLQVATQTVGVH